MQKELADLKVERSMGAAGGSRVAGRGAMLSGRGRGRGGARGDPLLDLPLTLEAPAHPVSLVVSLDVVRVSALRCILTRRHISNPDLLLQIRRSKGLSLLQPRASVVSPIGSMLAMMISKTMTDLNSRKYLPYNILNT